MAYLFIKANQKKLQDRSNHLNLKEEKVNFKFSNGDQKSKEKPKSSANGEVSKVIITAKRYNMPALEDYCQFPPLLTGRIDPLPAPKIGRASCRERV